MGGAQLIGIPRSRTQWFSEFLTYGDLIFTHEGINNCSTFGEYKELLSKGGDCGTGMMLWNVNKLLPNTRKVVIHKESIDSSVEFCRKNYGDFAAEHAAVMNEKLNYIDGLHVNYSDINNRLDEIWQFMRVDKAPDGRIEEYKNKIIKDGFSGFNEKCKGVINELSVYLW